MLRISRNSFAMGNAQRCQRSTLCYSSNDEDGVAFAIEKFI